MKWPCNGVFVHQINKKCKKKKINGKKLDIQDLRIDGFKKVLKYFIKYL